MKSARFSFDSGPISRESAALSLEIAAISLEIAALSLEIAAISLEIAALSMESAAISLEIAALSMESAAISLEIAALSMESAALSLEIAALSLEIAALSMESAALSTEEFFVPLKSLPKSPDASPVAGKLNAELFTASAKEPLMASFLPDTDNALLAWSLNFSTRITATPTAYGLVAGDATSYSALHDSFASAMANCDPDERNKIATAAKNSARSSLKNSARLLAKRVEGTATVTDAQKLELGLNVRQQPAPIPPPANAPGIAIVSMTGNTVKLRLFDPTDSAVRGKPAGVDGASIFSFVGATAPTVESEWNFEGVTSRTKFDVTFPETTAAGAKVWFTAFWFNDRKQNGPAAIPVGTNIPGGSAMAA